MLIQDIMMQEGRTECFDTSLGLLALPPISFPSYKGIEVGPVPEDPNPFFGNKFIVDIRAVPFYGPRRSG